MDHRPSFHRDGANRLRPYDSRKGPTAPKLGFGVKVAGLSALAFLVVLFSDRMPAAIDAAVGFTRDLGRENAPPAGAYYAGCDEARAAGVAPLYAGEPGYREGMDGDGDGVACEPYRGM